MSSSLTPREDGVDSELGEVSPDAAQRVAQRMSEGEPMMRFHVFRLLK